ncbi:MULTISPECIES: alpha-amylase family glycosyl hydrolase [unclassified Janthinobacterium]|uniref:alpha-amylase family glycosyl hydrolase n=1 Tax=unclassified Janthinobacterium TaxID=2610881 RepID=UPI001E5D308F|nr:MULTISPECIES: alpha-amylase family glycosyl hydrolase [unclassified Janthinobacterium]MEC5162457.1 amylosucrase [Janthinobacterium sp. CG_S6]
MIATFPPLQRMLAAMPAHLHADAARRYARHEPVLYQRLASLYGERADFDAWFGDLMEAVGRLHAARPPALLALDAERAERPDWFAGQRMLGYSAYAQRFGGTLRGVATRIPHLRELGVTYLHLLPFLRARAGESDGGFAVASFDEVEPALGSNADLEDLTAQLRENGISLCSDMVLNHVADDHPWALAAIAGAPGMLDYFHTYPNRKTPQRYERTLGQVFPQAAPGNFSYVAALGRWVWTTFYPYQWDLNYANPAVFGAIAEALLGLANRGVEVFRLDSTAFLWKREGSNCMNQPEAHSLLQAIRAIVAIAAPGVLLKAEAIVPTPLLPAYFGSAAAPECHIAYHSSLMAAAWGALAEQDTELLRRVIAATPPLPPHASWLSYVRCHDDIGWNVLRGEAGGDGADATARLARISNFFAGADGGYPAGAPFQTSGAHAAHGSNGMAASLAGLERADGEPARQQALRRLLLLHGLALCFGALPVLYMGDELGMLNDYAFLARPERAIDSRWLQRPDFDDARLAQRHDGASLAGRVHAGLRRMIAVRQQRPELAAGAPRALLDTWQAALLALARGPRFLFLGNFSGAEVRYQLAEGRWTDCLGGDARCGRITLQPWAMLWLERSA